MKEQIKVLINSKKEAKQVKAILKGLGEDVAYNFYDDSNLVDESECIYCNHAKKWLCYKSISTVNIKEISIRDLIILLTKPEKEKVFVMTSEDGVKLYYGHEYYGARFLGGLQKWELADFNGKPFELQDLHLDDESYDFPYLTAPKTNKAFSTKEAAEKWIEKANTPKMIIAHLYQFPVIAKVSKDNIIITDGIFTTEIKPSDLEEMTRALNEINNPS